MIRSANNRFSPSVTAAGIARLPIMFHLLDTVHPDPDPTFNIGYTVSAIETGLALITACVPDMIPLMRVILPSVFGKSTLRSNKDGYVTGTYGTKSRATRKPGYIQAGSKNTTLMSKPGEYQMDDGDTWRAERSRTGEIHINGGRSGQSLDSRNGSQEAITGEGNSIMKTTDIVIETHESKDNARWSNV